MTIRIEQALYHRVDFEDPQLIARSDNFLDAWLPQAEALVIGFGNRPSGTKCPHAVFAHQLTKNQVGVVQVQDQTINGRSGLAFLLYVIPYRAYATLLGDPFWVASRLPADWQARGILPELELPAAAIPSRTVQEVQGVLRRIKGEPLREDEDPKAVDRNAENSESPALLGGVQILVDGGRVMFERPTADNGMVQGLWMLLPTSTRSRLWPASFAFCNDLGFDALVVPRLTKESRRGYADEEQAADYPEGRYEYRLQRAAETGDQPALDDLLNRRSLGETWKLAIGLLVFFSILVFVTNFPFPPMHTPLPEADTEQKAALAAGTVSVGDPWTAMSMIQIGDEKWGK